MSDRSIRLEMTKARSLDEAARLGRIWLFEMAAPLWTPLPVGDAILFPERLSIRGDRDAPPYRLRVQARHIFSYCVLGRLGWDGPWQDMVSAGVGFLLRTGRRDDGFFVHSFDNAGRVPDSRADLYDQAFALLALAYAAHGLGRADLFEAAEAVNDALEAHWRLPNGCYHEGEVVPCPPYRQNPHMHLLECFAALYKFTRARRWRDRIEHLAGLCMRHFIDQGTGALTEYFDADLKPMPAEEGRIVEPGHCFEWAWLFESVAQWGLPGAITASDGLVSFARRYGIDRNRGVAINEVMTDGTVRDAGARLWPQTERLKAALARYGRTGEAVELEESVAAFAGLAFYFDTPKPGTWRDKLRPDGSFVEEPSPGSSFYHIVCALSELIDAGSTEPHQSTS